MAERTTSDTKNQMKLSPVYEKIVLNNLCIGCGTCAAVCPRRRLTVEWNRNGYYSVVQGEQECDERCGLCLKVCPFADGNENESEFGRGLFGPIPHIEFRSETGYFQTAYAGYSLAAGERSDGASGGMATWFLAELLRENIVDHVVCVRAGSAPGPLFEYVTCNDISQVRESARSAYYPVEMSSVLRSILENEGRYVIVCLPCYSKAIRLACGINKKLAKRIVCLVGLVCGHGANKYFAEYATEKAGGSAESMKKVVFRTKSSERSAADYGTECFWTGEDGAVKQNTVYWTEGLCRAWSSFWFTPNPCLFCDDVFAETADIVFMDAWLRDYIADFRGTSLSVVRSVLAEKICREGIKSGTVRLVTCSAEQVIKSQSSVVKNKREGLAHRLWSAQKNNLTVPVKRAYARRSKAILQRLIWTNQMRAVQHGPSMWRERKSMNDYEIQMMKIGQWERILKRIKEVYLLIFRVPRKIGRILIRGV